MNTFGWPARLKYAALAAVAGWLAGWLVSFPFEIPLAWRYVDAHASQLPAVLLKGSLIWAAFSLFIAMAGFIPLVLPAALLVPPRSIVRWHSVLIPAAPLIALIAIYNRMGLLHRYEFRHPEAIRAFFFTAPNFFVMAFALGVTWAYVLLARRRLSQVRANSNSN
jgi:hypothetical protein